MTGMRLLPKFTLIFLVVYGSGLALAAYFAEQFLNENAHDQVLGQARLMMESASATRTYTSEQIKPVIQQSAMNSMTFIPQTVPSYSAITNFGYLRKKYPDYTYREPALNPTNPRDRAMDWEADVILTFRNFGERVEANNIRDTPDGKMLWLARPIRSPAKCLECHSTPDAAPSSLIATYGPSNGFGWKADEVVAAQIVQVPMRVPEQIASKAFRSLMTYLGLVGIATLVMLNVALQAFVVRPVARLSLLADRISKGDLESTELPLKGSDEIAELAASFNRMKLSLAKALRMLEGE
jgi:HAMP domain-containing protein